MEYVRRRAADEHRTMASIIEDALRRDRAATGTLMASALAKLPVCGGRGPRPGVNLDNTAELLDRMDGRL